MKPLHQILILCTVAVWGVNFVATRVALEVFSPIQMAFVRSAITLVILLPWWQAFKGIPWKLALAALAIGAASFSLLYAAIDITESLTTVAVATQLMPVLSAILAWFFYHEQISGSKWLGIGIATAGAVYLAGATESALSVAALGLTVISVLFYSAGSIVIGKSNAVGIWRMLAWVSALSLLPLGLLTALSGPLLPAYDVMQDRHWMGLLFSVVFSGLLGQATLFYLYRQYPVSMVAPWVLLVPLFVGVSSIVFYDEAMTLTLILGGCIVMLGVWIQQRAPARTPTVTPGL
jgi:O-acetylserine/cysteine efflux transporter